MLARRQKSGPRKAMETAFFCVFSTNLAFGELYEQFLAGLGYENPPRWSVVGLQSLVTVLIAWTAYEYTSWREQRQRLQELPTYLAEPLARKW